ncbi:SH3 domain-containing protein, partial [Mycena metata]
MPEYVYALQDFAPGQGDEVAFRFNERIEVLEKDGRFHDGWWKGRNAAGKVGLFPKNCTSP